MIRRILALIRKEFITIWKDPKSRAMIFALPLMQLFIFANAITMEVQNIDMVVLDKDNTRISRELVSYFDASPRFRKILYAKNENDLKNRLEVQEVQIALEIPNNFTSSIKAQRPVEVFIAADGRQTNTASIASAYAAQIITDFGTQFINNDGAVVNCVIRNWFNENLDYRWFIMQVLVTMLALVITLLLTALSIARERESGTFDQLIVSPLNSFEILAGKTVPPLCIAVILTCAMTFIVTHIFGVPFRGSLLLFLIVVVTSLLSIVGIGLFISSISKTQQQAILGVLTFQMPAILLSGFISPIEDMPKLFQYFTIINPIRFFIQATRGIFFKNMGGFDVFLNIIPLIMIAAVTLSVAGMTFKRKLD